MSIDTILGGYMIDISGIRHQLSAVLNPSNSIIESTIKKVSSVGKGVVILKRKSAPEIGPEKLELYVDTGKFFLMLGVNEENGDYSVRTLTNESLPNELIVIIGEKYPARAVTHSIDLAYASFNEFSNRGDVPLMR
jgi:hypothetical protein